MRIYNSYRAIYRAILKKMVFLKGYRAIRAIFYKYRSIELLAIQRWLRTIRYFYYYIRDTRDNIIK